MEDKRIEFYNSLLEIYNYFNCMQYNNGVHIFENMLKDIEALYKQSSYFEYHRRRMEYSRAIPKSARSKQKKFIEWFHKAMFNISRNHYLDSYSYIRDMKTILEELNDNNRIA